MNSGFKTELLRVLKLFHLRTTNAKGLVLTGGTAVYSFLENEGFDVEYGEGSLPEYAFIYIPNAKVTKESVAKTLTKTEKCGIIVFSQKNSKLLWFIPEMEFYATFPYGDREVVYIQKKGREEWKADSSSTNITGVWFGR